MVVGEWELTDLSVLRMLIVYIVLRGFINDTVGLKGTDRVLIRLLGELGVEDLEG